MMDIISLVSFILFAFIFCFVLALLIKEKNKTKTLKVQLINLIQERMILDQRLSLNDPNSVAHTQGFLKFLTDSRDWAFKYIEDVQESLNNFMNSVEPEITHFKEYGDVLSTNSPHYPAMKKIAEEYDKLKELLPKDEQ